MKRAAFLLLLAVLAVFGLHAHAYPRPGTVELVSLGADGRDGNRDSGSVRSHTSLVSAPISMTPDGRYVAFESLASNLVPGDLDEQSDVFVRDRVRGTTAWVSKPTGGLSSSVSNLAALCGAGGPSISASGRYVAFTGCYQFLDGRPTVPLGDVFVRDLRTGLTTRLSVTPSGGVANGASGQSSISANGRYVAFTSRATNLGPQLGCPSDVVHTLLCKGGFGATDQVYVRDLRTRTTRLVSSTRAGKAGDGNSSHPSISPDGRYVAFASTADNLDADDTNSCPVLNQVPSCSDVFLKDLRTGTVRLVSAALDGHSPVGTGGSGIAFVVNAISANDRYVAFASNADGLVPNGGGLSARAAGCGPGYYVRDLKSRRTTRVSVDATGNPLCTNGAVVSLDATGRFATFESLCPGHDYGSSPGGYFVADYDIATGGVWFAGAGPAAGKVDSCADPSMQNLSPVVSAGGRFVAFASNRADLAAGSTNGDCTVRPGVSVGPPHCWDVFVQDGGPPMGVGRLTAGQRVSVVGHPGFAAKGFLDRKSSALARAVGALRSAADLIEARLSYRPQRRDLFVRLAVSRMPEFALVNPAILYGLSFRAGGTRYQVRVGKVSPVSASFELFRMSGTGSWIPQASLHGGYGTTGQEVVVAVPLRELGKTGTVKLSDVRAYAALSTHASGFQRVLDEIVLSR